MQLVVKLLCSEFNLSDPSGRCILPVLYLFWRQKFQQNLDPNEHEQVNRRRRIIAEHVANLVFKESLWVDSERLTLNDHLFSQHRIRERAIRLALLPLENISFELFSLAIEVFNQNQRTTHIKGLSVETGDKILIHGVHDFAWCEQHNVMFAEGQLREFSLFRDVA